MIEEGKKKERVVLEFSCRVASVRFWKIQKTERKNKTWSDCQRNVSYIAHLPGIAKLCQKNILLCKMLLSFHFFSFFLKFTSNQIKKRFINSGLNLFIAQSFFGWNMHKKERVINQVSIINHLKFHAMLGTCNTLVTFQWLGDREASYLPYLWRSGNRTCLCRRNRCTPHTQTPPCPLGGPRELSGGEQVRPSSS